jgi:hypothetical protein
MLAISLNFQQRKTGFLFQPYCQQLGDGGKPERKSQTSAEKFKVFSAQPNVELGSWWFHSYFSFIIGQYREIFISGFSATQTQHEKLFSQSSESL